MLVGLPILSEQAIAEIAVVSPGDALPSQRPVIDLSGAPSAEPGHTRSVDEDQRQNHLASHARLLPGLGAASRA